MNIYETELQKQENRLPTQLDFLRIAKQRGLPLSKKEESRLYTLEVGEMGEQIVLQFLQKFGREHWTVMRNLWVDYSSPYESDFLLFTSHRPYLLEVKNYYGKFVYDNGVCFLEGKKLDNNPIFQTQRAHMNLQKISQEVDPSIQAKGGLILIGEHNEMELKSEVRDIEVKTRNQFRKYIRSIRNEEMNHQYYPIDATKIISQLESYETTTRFRPTSLQPKNLRNAHKGIYCNKCKSYAININKHSIQCNSCQSIESREEAIFRTICEFGVLTFAHDYMKRSDLSEFLNQRISRGYLINFLKKHFEVVGHYKSTRYLSKKLPSHKLSKPF